MKTNIEVNGVFRITRAWETKAYGNDSSLAKFGAVHNKNKKVNGDWESTSFFVNVVGFGKKGQMIGDEDPQPGDVVYISGSLDPNEYTSRDGEVKSSNQIVARTVIMIQRKGEGKKKNGPSGSYDSSGSDHHFDPGDDEFGKDDIPF